MKTIVLSSTFNTSAELLYKFFTDSKLHTEITGSKALIKDKVGGTFTAWDGYIKGEITALEKNKKIIQKWRTTEFDETDKDSTLEITIEEIDKNKSRLQLKHDGVPKGTEEEYKDGWKEYYLKPLKEFIKKQKGAKSIANT